MIEKKLKKRSPYLILLIIVLVGMHNCFRIEKLTHLSDEDLAWTDCYKPNDTLFFRNSEDQIDTMTITEIIINNSIFPYMNPFHKWETSADYNAAIFLYFNILHQGIDYKGNIFVTKNVSYAPPMLSWKLGNLSSLTPYFSNKESEEYTIYTPCFTANMDNSENIKHLAPSEDSTQYIESFEWCKDIGLKSYTFRNGEVYELAEDK